jgi:hypothetical protein
MFTLWFSRENKLGLDYIVFNMQEKAQATICHRIALRPELINSLEACD